MRAQDNCVAASHSRFRCACGEPKAGRRQVLGGFAALGGLSLASGCATLGAGDSAAARIDVHHHIVPPAWLESLRRAKLDSPPVVKWTVQQSLEDMDRGGRNHVNDFAHVACGQFSACGGGGARRPRVE